MSVDRLPGTPDVVDTRGDDGGVPSPTVIPGQVSAVTIEDERTAARTHRASNGSGRAPGAPESSRPARAPARPRTESRPPKARRISAEQRRVAGRLFLGDVLAIATAILAGIMAGWGGGSGSAFEDPVRIYLGLAMIVIWPVMLWQRRAYAVSVLGQGPEEYRRVLVASGWAAALVAAGAYLTDNTQSRMFFIGVTIVGGVLLLTMRWALRRNLGRWLADGVPLQRIYVVADPVEADHLTDELERSQGLFAAAGHWNLGRHRPEPEEVLAAAIDAQADTLLYSASSGMPISWVRRLNWAMEQLNMTLMVSPSLVGVAGPRLFIEPVQGLHLVRVESPRFSGPGRVIKRCLDIVGSALGLAVLGIPILAVAVWIRRDSPGPAIFKQTRSGKDGQTFECWKFRTMVADADAQRGALRETDDRGNNGALFKMAEDPRVTRVGRLLRRTSLDELPQLVNVLKGEMSLVGPRPHPLDDVERYDDTATRRLLSKPGMTGLWQVSGRSDLDWDDAMMLDLYYVENWSFWLDLLIMARTVKVVAVGSGAY